LEKIKEEIWDKAFEWHRKVENKLWMYGRGEAGVAIYFIRALIALLLGGIMWYVGNLILFDPEIGIVQTTDNMTNATETYFGNISGAVEWFWSIFPFVFMIGAAVYVIYGALKEEPYRR